MFNKITHKLYLVLDKLTPTVFPVLGVGLIVLTFGLAIVGIAKPNFEEPLVPYAQKVNTVLNEYLPNWNMPHLKWNDDWSKGKFPNKGE